MPLIKGFLGKPSILFPQVLVEDKPQGLNVYLQSKNGLKPGVT